jgi:hypothetical protein
MTDAGPEGPVTGMAAVGGTEAGGMTVGADTGLQAAINNTKTTRVEPIKYILFILISLQASNEPSIENTLWKMDLDLFNIKVELEKIPAVCFRRDAIRNRP